METSRFRIVKSVFTASRKQTFRVSLIYLMIFYSVIIVSKYVDDETQTTVQAETEARKLAYMLTKWARPASVFPSSWRENERYINSSQYKTPYWEGDPLIVWTFMAFYNWSDFYRVVSQLATFIITFSISSANFILRRFGWRKLIVFTCTCAFLSYAVIFGIVEILMNIATLIRDSIIKWLEGNIYDAGEVMELPEFRDYRSRHPDKNGIEAPFFMYEYHRYNKEDIVLECEYVVQSLQDAKPIYKTTGWRKNGIPIVSSDRMYINVSITALNTRTLDVPSVSYSIFTTLTILLIEDTDYGSYTCDLYNPMHVHVRPGDRMNARFMPTEEYRRVSPNPACGCKRKQPPPPPPPIRRQCAGSSQTQDQILNKPKHVQCFAEFSLKQHMQRMVPVTLNPGSIVIETVTYHTLSDSTDVEFDITAFADKDHSCCSRLLLFYWFLTRYKSFNRFPDSRIIHDEDYLFQFVRVQCLCKSSFGTRDFVIHRNYFNTSHGFQDQAQIVYPVKLKLIPSLSHPFNQGTQSLASIDGNTECWDSKTPSTLCEYYYQAFDFFYHYDELIFIMLQILCITIISISLSLTYRSIVSVASVILYYGIEDEPFLTVGGSELKQLKPSTIVNINNDSSYYDIYLAYDEEEDYDLMLAQNLKELLLSKKKTVFDIRTDIDPGHPQLHEMSQAIEKSHRFVVFASKAYIENYGKLMEFLSIQDHITSQGTRLKDRIIIILTEYCEIHGCSRVPCIRISPLMKNMDALDVETLLKFLKWEESTRPVNNEMHRSNIKHKNTEQVSIFSKVSWLQSTFLLTLLVFAIKRFLPLWFVNHAIKSYWYWDSYLEKSFVRYFSEQS